MALASQTYDVSLPSVYLISRSLHCKPEGGETVVMVRLLHDGRMEHPSSCDSRCCY